MKCKIAFALLLASGVLACAQNTTITGTVVDSDGTTWAGGSWTLAFKTAPNQSNLSVYTIGGGALDPAVMNQSGNMDSSGAFSISAYNSTFVSPSGSAWVLTICPRSNASCGVYTFSSVGASLDISSNITGVIPPPRFNALAGAYGYADVEAQTSILTGGTYWNVARGVQRCYNGHTWADCGGASGIGGSGTANYIPMFLDATTLEDSPCLIDPVTNDLSCGNPVDLGYIQIDSIPGGGAIQIYAPDDLTTIEMYTWPTINTAGAMCNDGTGILSWGTCGVNSLNLGAGLTGDLTAGVLSLALLNTGLSINHIPMELGGDYSLPQLQSDWAQVDITQADFIKNKPVIASATSMLISGGGVSWTGGLNFTISAADYQISGTPYNSVQTDVTLATADSTNPRLDAFVVDDTGVASVITGTPAPTPATPSIDPTSQLFLGTVLVAAGATTPTITNENIYLENTEWTSAVTTHFDAASTSNPYQGTKDIEATAAVAGNNVTLAKPSGTENLTTWNTLTFYIRNKASWASTKSLSIVWMNGATPVGTAIGLKNGVYGFNQANTSTYQQIVIPLTAFQAGTTLVNTLKFQVAGSGAAIGFYIDNVSIQTSGSGSGSGGGLFQVQSDWLQSNNALPDFIKNKPVISSGSTISVNADVVADPHFNSTSPATEANYTPVKFLHTTGPDVSAEVLSPYNPPNTTYIVTGESDNMSADQEVHPVASAVSCNGTTCTLTVTTSTSDPNWQSGVWMLFNPELGAWTPSCLNGTTAQIVTNTGTTLTFSETANTGHAGCTGAQTGTGGEVYSMRYSWPFQVADTALFKGHGTMYNFSGLGYTTADVIAQYATYVHPLSPAVTGNPGFYILSVGRQDTLGCTVATTTEANIKTIYALANTDNFTVVAVDLMADSATPYGCVNDARVQEINDWMKGQKCNQTSRISTGQCWSEFVDIHRVMNSAYDAIYFNSDHLHPTQAGQGAVAAEFIRALASHTDVPYTGLGGMSNTPIGVNVSEAPAVSGDGQANGLAFYACDHALWIGGGDGGCFGWGISSGATPHVPFEFTPEKVQSVTRPLSASGTGRDTMFASGEMIGWSSDAGLGPNPLVGGTPDKFFKRLSAGVYALGTRTSTTDVSGELDLAALKVGGVPITGGSIANIQITTGTTAIAANSCTTVATATMTGLEATNTLTFTPTSDVSGVTGWGAGVLYFVAWGTTNTEHDYVCNGSSSSVTPGGSVTWNVSAK